MSNSRTKMSSEQSTSQRMSVSDGRHGDPAARYSGADVTSSRITCHVFEASRYHLVARNSPSPRPSFVFLKSIMYACTRQSILYTASCHPIVESEVAVHRCGPPRSTDPHGPEVFTRQIDLLEPIFRLAVQKTAEREHEFLRQHRALSSLSLSRDDRKTFESHCQRRAGKIKPTNPLIRPKYVINSYR